MRTCVTVVAMALVVGFLSLSVGAEVITVVGPNEGHIKDISHHFSGSVAGDPVSGTPVTMPHQVGPGDELRALYRLDDLELMGSLTGKYWFHKISTGDEVTGLLYDLVLTRVDAGGSLYYSALGRNPLSASDDKDGDISSWAAGSYGGVIELYADGSPDLDATLLGGAGPGLWQPGAGPIRPSGVAADGYPSASDGTLWLSGVLLDLSVFGAGQTGELYVLTPIAPGYYSGLGYMNVFDGSVASTIDLGAMPSVGPGNGLADVVIQTTVSLGTNVWGNPNWQSGSSDPARFDVVPEPATMLTVALGTVLVGWFRRRGTI